MKKILLLIIPIIVILIIILSQPGKEKKEEIKKITDIRSFEYYYTMGYSINSDVRYIVDCGTICTARIKPYGISDDDIKTINVDESFMKSLINIMNKNEVVKWDGFDRVAKDVLDGDSFSFKLNTKDDIKVNASGYMLWPDNYRNVKEEIDNLFNTLLLGE